MKSKKIVYCAVSAALSTVVILICAYTPVKFVPLVFASLAYYIALDRCGWWGLLSVIASMTIAFFTGGAFQTSFVLTLILFAPYALLAYAVRKIEYTSVKNWIIRGGIMIAFALISATLAIFLMEFITGVSLEVVIDKLGEWAILLIFAVAALPTDFFFTYAAQKVLKIIGKGK